VPRPEPTVETLPLLAPEEVEAVEALVAAATAHDGVAPLAEHALLAVRQRTASATRHLLLRDGAGTLVGYAQVQPASPPPAPAEGTGGHPATAELVVHPLHRGRGFGTAGLAAARQLAGGALSVWAHGNTPAAQALAASAGLDVTRVLRRLCRTLDEPLPDVPVPEGVRLRTFQPGRDEEAWLALNARAFAAHPEQGALTRADLEERLAEPWFDPTGFFLAERAGGGDGPGAGEPDGGLLGFHWTKRHGSDLGEVYVLGVDPRAQGRGLARALLVAGLRHLRDEGLPAVMLYVEGDAVAANRLYASVGFDPWDVDVQYGSGQRPHAGAPERAAATSSPSVDASAPVAPADR
jgi:mycothiol synthase